MLWLLFSLLTAFFVSLKDVLSKQSLASMDEYSASFFFRLVIFLFILPFLLLQGFAEPGMGFWIALPISGSINAVATLLFMRAVKSSELSLAVPLRNFTPLFLLATSPLILRELPSSTGILGVLLIVGGAYLLNLESGSYGLEPLRALARERGPRLMLLAAFLWSISSSYDKIGVQASSPLLWVASVNFFVVLSLLPLALLNVKLRVVPLRGAVSISMAGVLGAIGLFFQMKAITLTLVAYVISIKRLGVLFSVLWGRVIFKEAVVEKRILGASLMVAGAALIALS